MDIKAEKLDLIQWLAELSDESIIAKIIALRKGKGEIWEGVNSEEKSAIEEGIRQADAGETLSHDEVKKSYEKWL